jgi:hypothetical protein
MKINKQIDIPNLRTDLEKLLLISLDSMNIPLEQPIFDDNAKYFNFTRIAKTNSGKLIIHHKKEYDGREAREQIALFDFDFKNFFDTILISLNRNKPELIYDNSDKQSCKYINKIFKYMEKNKLEDSNDIIRFVKLVVSTY